MKLNFIKFKKPNNNNFLFKAPLQIARHPVFSSIVLVFIAVIFSLLLFYKSVLQQANIQTQEEKAIFREDLYQKMQEIWQAQTQKISEINSESYRNPFKSSQFPLE